MPVLANLSVLTAAEARQFLDYDPLTGVLRWREPTSTRMKVGDVAGNCRADGYILVRINLRRYVASRVIWLMMTGEWPPVEIEVDHRDGDPANMRWENLRLAAHQQNMINRKLQVNSSSGLKGVSLAKGRWRARINLGRKEIGLGTFATKEEAAVAYAAAAKKLYGEFNREDE